MTWKKESQDGVQCHTMTIDWVFPYDNASLKKGTRIHDPMNDSQEASTKLSMGCCS
jgi:hypothetical protein